MEILEQDEVLELARRISQQGFAFITDKLAESFDTSQPPTSSVTFADNPGTSSDENARSVPGKDQIQVDDAFTSPCGISMPLVKLLPVLLSVVQEDELAEEEEVEEETDEWIQHIISKFKQSFWSESDESINLAYMIRFQAKGKWNKTHNMFFPIIKVSNMMFEILISPALWDKCMTQRI